MIDSNFHNNLSLPRPPAPVRFIRGRIENIQTLSQRASFWLLKTRRVLSRYKQLCLAFIAGHFPLLIKPVSLETKKAKLLRLLHFAKENIPRYQETLGGLTSKSPESLETLFASITILTKATIRANFPDRLLTPNKTFSPGLLARTSGSTAQSIQHIRPDNADTRTLINSVIHYEKGLLTSPVFVLSTPHCSGLNCAISQRGSSDNLPLFSRTFFTRHLGEMVPLTAEKNILESDFETFHSIRTTLLKHQPSILVGDPVYLSAFAWYLIENNLSAPKVRFILTSYELLTPSQKSLLTEVFQCVVHSQYGGSEVLGVARTCRYGFFHEDERLVWVEVLKQGRPALPGEIGEIFLTDLSNFNMPFIRYQIGDAVERISGACPCGSTASRLGLIHGRTGDLIMSSHETPQIVSPLRVDSIFYGMRGVKFYRLVHKKDCTYELSYIPSLFFKESDLDLISKKAQILLGERAQITIKKKGFFRPEPSMKFRFSFSECGSKLI